MMRIGLIFFILIISVFNLHAQSLESYTHARTGNSYRIDDPIQLGRGSNSDGSFKFIYWQSALVAKMDMSVLSPGYAGTRTEFKSFRVSSTKGGKFYTATLKLAGNTGYNCVVELDNAFRFGELVAVGTPLNASDSEEPREKIVIKTVPGAIPEEIAQANKKMDTELKRSQRELDSLRSSRIYQDKQLKEKENEIRRRQAEADIRAAEIKKLAEDTTLRGQEILEKAKAIGEMKYQNELIQNQLELERKEIEIREGELEKQKIIRNSLIAGFGFILLVVILLLYFYRINKRNNHLLSKRNDEIMLQKEEIEKKQIEISVKNRQITDSISYAKRIQEASLPGRDQIAGKFQNSFLYFRPRDIVSGDFYWYYENDRYQFLAVVDCTGHGVPGAFMSLIGVNLLAETVEVNKNCEPAEILYRINDRVQQVLRQTGDRKDPRDGMDMIILVIDHQEKTVKYSGANRPLLHIRNGALQTYKGNKYSIGGFYQDQKVFEQHTLDLVPGDCFIMFTDGLPDQMGGERKRKLSTRKLTEWIYEVMQLPVDEQNVEFERRMVEWQNNNRQLDDMLLWAIKV